MSPDIIAELQKEEHTDFHKKLFEHCMGLVETSRAVMSKRYTDWDRYDEIYQGKRQLDEQDKKAIARGEPEKIVVPVTYEQIQSFVGFCYGLYMQREFMFELTAMNPESETAARYGEALLQRDLNHNRFAVLLSQFLLDVGRFGLGVLKPSWVVEKSRQRVQAEPTVLGVLGKMLSFTNASTVVQEMVTYQGNRIDTVSPYRFFPDVRIPLHRFQEGEFVASEDDFSHVELKRLEKDGVVAGIGWIPKWTRLEDATTHRKKFGASTSDLAPRRSMLSQDTVIVTEVQVKLVPSEFILDSGEPMGPETYPVKYLVWYANDNRIIRAEPLAYLHDQFTYVVAPFNTDQHHFLNMGLSELTDPLQNVITWLINSHITSVRKNISNYLVVDPIGVELEDLNNRRPVIRLKPGVARSGVDTWIKQLAVSDVTSAHVADSEVLHKVLQRVTGINDSIIGQYQGGRRQATEVRQVSAAAASRLKTVAACVYFMAIEPLGRQMLSNLRDGLTEETFVKTFGGKTDPLSVMQFKGVTRDDIAGQYQFEVYDGTMPSDKLYQANAIKEVLLSLLQNPEASFLLGLDPKLMLFEMLELEGVKNPQRFQIQDPAKALALAQMYGQQANATGPGVSQGEPGVQNGGGNSRNGSGGTLQRSSAPTA